MLCIFINDNSNQLIYIQQKVTSQFISNPMSLKVIYIIKKKEMKEKTIRQDKTTLKKEMVNDTLMDTLGVKND